MTEENKDKGNLVDFNELARRQREDKVKKLLRTSFHNLHGKGYEEKLDLIFEKLMKMDEAQDKIYERLEISGNIMEFLMSRLENSKELYRSFENTKYGLEELEENALVQSGYSIETEFGYGDKDVKIPMQEISVKAKAKFPILGFDEEIFIGMRIGEKRDIGNGQYIKITRGRRKVNKTIPKPEETSNVDSGV